MRMRVLLPNLGRRRAHASLAALHHQQRPYAPIVSAVCVQALPHNAEHPLFSSYERNTDYVRNIRKIILCTVRALTFPRMADSAAPAINPEASKMMSSGFASAVLPTINSLEQQMAEVR